MPTAEGIDKLSVYSQFVARSLDAALQHIANSKFLRDLFWWNILALVVGGRIARDDKNARDLREVGDQIVRHAIGEILLFWIVAHIRERQHRDRRLVWKR